MNRAAVFGIIAAACIAVGGYAVWQAGRITAPNAPGDSTAPPTTTPSVAKPQTPYLLGLSVSPGFYGLRGTALGVTAGSTPESARFFSDLSCERVSYAAGVGICVQRSVLEMSSSVSATLFDANFGVLRSIPLDGIYGSRTRVSPDGKYGAVTTFVDGHSYADASFSTATVIISMADGGVLGNLEMFTTTRDGAVFSAPDFNFWGVTFARDSNRFYATLATGGQIYLVEGDVAARALRVLARDVECPSLSPDETRLAFKKRTGLATWRLHVYDLRTGAVMALAETDSVDDQAYWLDDARVLYQKLDASAAPKTDTWVVNADGGGAPMVFAQNLQSAVVAR
jgi:Tol biopolymer transport system component